ncbi:rho GTPase-activating protein 45 isoform X3 [Erpetoichthys calabaricus]|uniref:rho GTPase-activating protein 45 isoform X3 n=1 Tax=Erpetoichthys calabaricus TaxID=27687 RepID=UPI0022349647|nr:rho GTPase-activating protein 45 isoform X3 [Erpetoichthys calabaricus]
MLKRGVSGKTSYSPYSTDQRTKKNASKGRSQLDVLQIRPNVWLKQEQPRKDATEMAPVFTDPSSSPGMQSQISKITNCPSPAVALKRPVSLSRHASAAGFPTQTAGTWGFSKAHKGIQSYSPTAESGEGYVLEVEDISQLLRHVEWFAEAVDKLREVVLGESHQENQRPLAHECLGEVLRILRQVINKYPLLKTVEVLTAAGTLISKVKGFHYEANIEADKKDFEKAVETIAVAFSSNVSELLMGEVDNSTLLSLPLTEKSRSMENLYSGLSGPGFDMPSRSELQEYGFSSSEEVDILLQRGEGGVDSALQYAKVISKYMKDILYYVEKRTALEVELAKGLQKLYHGCRPMLTNEPYMPFLSIYEQALEQDMEQSCGLIQAATTLQSQTFIQPLMQRRLEHEKKRKEIKEQWHRAQRKLMDAETNLRKAKQIFMMRCEEYDKAKHVTVKAEEDQHGSNTNSGKSLEKKRRLEEEARNKAEEAEATYRTCIADAKTQKQELEDVKVNVLRQLQEIIKQSDQTMRSATISYYQNMHGVTAPLPVNYQTLCENSKSYDPGKQYAAYVKQLQLTEEVEVHYDFEPYAASSSHLPGRLRHDSFTTEDKSGTNTESPSATEDAALGQQATQHSEGSGLTHAERRAGRGHQSHKSWPSTISDTDSMGGLDSPSTSSGDIRKLPRTSSTGTMSSNEEADEKDGNTTSFEQSINGIEPEHIIPTGPFRNVGLSKAAQTHRLRKLRTPSKCRECDSYVYFQGAECEECFLACHKKCLETLAIQCGHKKLQGKLQLFGRDFAQTSRDSPGGIPFIIVKCISEIESRALKIKGIYRVNGVKTRVEKLCQAFENGKELVELSHASPHDISNVLKLYLRQLPEPIMSFRLYNDLMGLAKESLQVGPEGVEHSKVPELVDRGSDTEEEVLACVDRLRELLKELPAPNVATLQYIIRHLRKIAEVEQDNKMTSSNLGIVFGPTLMRPRPTGATISLSSLVDYPYQARIVETLIVFYSYIFEPRSSIILPKACNKPCAESCETSEDCSGLTDGQDESEEQEHLDSDRRGNPGCGNSLCSSGSQERSLDSDSDSEDAGIVNRHAIKTNLSQLTKQESITSTEDGASSEDQLSPRSSLDLSAHLRVQQEDSDDQDPSSSLSEHNSNQSNNVQISPALLPPARVTGGKLKPREKRKPEFV